MTSETESKASIGRAESIDQKAGIDSDRVVVQTNQKAGIRCIEESIDESEAIGGHWLEQGPCIVWSCRVH
jgi:hypothetical protein